jgi:hypothetical protein
MINSSRVMEPTRDPLELCVDMLRLVDKWLKISLATLPLPIITEHEQILSRSGLLFLGYLIPQVISYECLDLLVQVELSLHFFLDIVELKLMLAVYDFLSEEFFNFVF